MSDPATRQSLALFSLLHIQFMLPLATLTHIYLCCSSCLFSHPMNSFDLCRLVGSISVNLYKFCLLTQLCICVCYGEENEANFSYVLLCTHKQVFHIPKID